jgi:CRISPR-associated protein Cas5h
VKAVRFKLSGKLAHFRRFYSNSSSLTYPIPPPTTVAGIIGAALGLEAADYPSALAGVRYGICPPKRWRTILQTINLLLVKDPGHLTGADRPTQVPTQFLAPYDLGDSISFSIVVTSESEGLVDQIAEALFAPVFPPYLGTAYCLGHFTDVQATEGALIRTYRGNVLGALARERIGEIRPREGQRILRDRYPLRLDGRRDLVASGDLLIEATGQPLDVEVGDVLLLRDQEAYALL